jgi:hypothetical protein
VFLLVAASYVPLARYFHYATLGGSGRGAALFAIVPAALAATHLYERAVRGALYGVLGRRLPTGLAAPVMAILGAVLPAFLRLEFLPRSTAPFAVLVGHAFLVEAGLGLALCLLALGAGSTVPGGVAYGLLWALRFGVGLTFVGGVVPLMELAAAWAAPVAVAIALARPLAPYREELL